MSTLKGFLHLSDRVYCGYIGVDTRSGDLTEWYEKYGKNKLSIAQQLDKEDTRTASRILGGQHRANSVRIPKSRKPGHGRVIIFDKPVNTREQSRKANLNKWLLEMESEGYYTKQRISEITSISFEKIKYAIQKQRMEFTKIKPQSARRPIELITIAAIEKWKEERGCQAIQIGIMN